MHINGMNGRMLKLPAKKKKREILLLYGHHASLERMFGIAEVLNPYGAITMPDLPGFGGMDSFYKIKKRPTLDNYADYLATFVKLHYKKRRFTIVAMSFSVPLIVRMLHKYPDIAKKVDIVVSISGFVHREDFIFKPSEYWALRTTAWLFKTRLGAAFMNTFMLNGPQIRFVYTLMQKGHKKMQSAKSKEELKKRIDFEIVLWQINDARTRMSTMEMMLTLDLCTQRIDLPIYHVTAIDDRYFDNKIVEQHMKIVFREFELVPSEMANHAPTIIATAKEAAPYIPKRIRTILS